MIIGTRTFWKSIDGFRASVMAHVRFVLLITMLAICAGNLPGQDLDRLARNIKEGTTEEKRDALFEIRNLKSREAALIAAPALNDPNPIVRATAACSVEYLPEAEAAVLLTPLLRDKNAFVRREAVGAIGRAHAEFVQDRLIQLMKEDKAADVRSAAATALGSADSSAVEALVGVLEKKPKDDDQFLRRSTAHSIGRIAETLRGVLSTSTTPQNFLPAKYKNSTSVAPATKLSSVYEPALNTLIRIVGNRKEDDDTRREAAFSLGAIGDSRAIPVLQANLNSKDNYLAEIAKEALLKIPNPQ